MKCEYREFGRQEHLEINVRSFGNYFSRMLNKIDEMLIEICKYEE